MLNAPAHITAVQPNSGLLRLCSAPILTSAARAPSYLLLPDLYSQVCEASRPIVELLRSRLTYIYRVIGRQHPTLKRDNHICPCLAACMLPRSAPRQEYVTQHARNT